MSETRIDLLRDKLDAVREEVKNVMLDCDFLANKMHKRTPLGGRDVEAIAARLRAILDKAK